jgi:hypothetical protein
MSTVPEQKTVIATGSQTHRRQQWGIVNLRYTGGAAGQFSISTNGNAAASAELTRSFDAEWNNDTVLEIGGCSAERESLFYGEIAELIVFRRSLANDEMSAVTRHLIQTHRL